MPPKSHSRRKPTPRRRPLSDVSNRRDAPPRACQGNKEAVPGGGDSAALDRLVAAHADISKLIKQIDELVGKTLKQKMISTMGCNEIESFSRYLYDIQSSLQSWVPRFEKVFSNSSVADSDAIVEKFSADEDIAASKEDSVVISDAPEEHGMDLIVSPSPLVSWRTGTCMIETGKQLFLLTPLPKTKSAHSKCPAFSKTAVKNFAHGGGSSSIVRLPPSSTACGNSTVTLPEILEVNKTMQNNNVILSAIQTESAFDHEFPSPLKLSNKINKDHSIYLLTPCPHPSARATKVQFGSVSKTHKKREIKKHKLTPWIPREKFQSFDDDSSDEAKKDTGSSLPDIFNFQFFPATQTVDKNESLDWFLSPPKTCVLLEPSDNGSPLDSANNFEFLNDGISQLNLDVTESTPMRKDVESTVHKGKKPGENTLKRELWTKFEVVSAPGWKYDASALQKTSSKGFLDKLEEVSCETNGPS